MERLMGMLRLAGWMAAVSVALIGGSASADATALRIPAAAFVPAVLAPQWDLPVTARDVDQKQLGGYHWWSYSRLGMGRGYYETGAGRLASGDYVTVAWLGSEYANSQASALALGDAASKFRYVGQTWNCAGGFDMPSNRACHDGQIIEDHILNQYYAFQVRNCLGEINVLDIPKNGSSFDLTGLGALETKMFTTGVRVLEGACSGHSSAPHPLTSPAPIQPGFHGDCATFRGQMWSDAQMTSVLMGVWWSSLEKDYSGNYPPATGGSLPGYTQTQYQAARVDMAGIQRAVYNRRTRRGLQPYFMSHAADYGVINPWVPGPANWAVRKLYNTLSFVAQASHDEWHVPGSGIAAFHQAQQELGYTWQALKQLPCPDS